MKGRLEGGRIGGGRAAVLRMGSRAKERRCHGRKADGKGVGKGAAGGEGACGASGEKANGKRAGGTGGKERRGDGEGSAGRKRRGGGRMEGGLAVAVSGDGRRKPGARASVRRPQRGRAPARALPRHTHGGACAVPSTWAFVDKTGRVVEAHRAVGPLRRLRNASAAAVIERFAACGPWFQPGDRVGLSCVPCRAAGGAHRGCGSAAARPACAWRPEGAWRSACARRPGRRTAAAVEPRRRPKTRSGGTETTMKTCPVCKSHVFDDMDVCYGCMHPLRGRWPGGRRRKATPGCRGGGNRVSAGRSAIAA